MRNQWTIQAGGKSYDIQVRGWSVLINGEKYKIKDLQTSRKFLIFMEYQLPIQGANVLLASDWFYKLIVDGVDVKSGKPYQPLDHLPKWFYIFAALNLANLINGAVGGAMAVVGMTLTASVATRPGVTTGVKVLISAAILLGCWAVVFAVAYLVSFVL